VLGRRHQAGQVLLQRRDPVEADQGGLDGVRAVLDVEQAWRYPGVGRVDRTDHQSTLTR
jgi:hypothetical protein